MSLNTFKILRGSILATGLAVSANVILSKIERNR